MVRWDSPLFTVPWLEETLPVDYIWKAVMEGSVKPPNAGTQAVRLTSSRSAVYLSLAHPSHLPLRYSTH